MNVRPYEPDDFEGLWQLKRSFERGLGSGTGDATKEARYERKLTAAYRERYRSWVERCCGSDERCVTVLEDDAGTLQGYVFVLPETTAMIWDSAVLNELYLEPELRGTGAADDLIEAALALGRDQDLPLDRMILDVDPDNERALGFYERHGFEPWGELVARDLR